MLQRFKGRTYPVQTGRTGEHTEFVPLSQVIGARFVLFRVACPLNTLTLCADYARRVETTFRMAFKGGLSLFSGAGGELCIQSLHFDGYRQYGRRLDLPYILRNMQPDGFRIPSGITLDDATSDHRRADCQSYDDCQLLQLTDLLVSGFRTVLGEATHDAQRVACEPLRVLAEKWGRGRKGFSNSRWYMGFCISEGSIKDGMWQFGPILPARDSGSLQPRLF